MKVDWILGRFCPNNIGSWIESIRPFFLSKTLPYLTLSYFTLRLTKCTLPISFTMEEEDKLFSKLLTKDSANSSSRIFYYGRNPGAVPFQWESQPGTPKHHANAGRQDPLPLAPPPCRSITPKHKSTVKKKSIAALFSKLNIRRSLYHHASPSSSLSAWSPRKIKSGSGSRVFRGCYPVPSVKGAGVLWATLRRHQAN